MLAKQHEDGSISHILVPPEIHGNPMDPNSGVLAFWHHGWDFVKLMIEIGFSDAKVNFCNNVYKGYFGCQFLISGSKSDLFNP